MVDLSTVKTDASKLEAEVGFVRANWGKLSAVIIIAVAIGIAIGKFLL